MFIKKLLIQPPTHIYRSNPSTFGNISFFVSSEFIYFYVFLLLIIIVNRFCWTSFFACWTCSSGIIAIICTPSPSLIIHLYFQYLLFRHRILSHQTLVRCEYLTVLHSARSYLNLTDLKLRAFCWKTIKNFQNCTFFSSRLRQLEPIFLERIIGAMLLWSPKFSLLWVRWLEQILKELTLWTFDTELMPLLDIQIMHILNFQV